MTAYIRLYGRLNDYLPVDKKQKRLNADEGVNRTVKDLVESLGPPHTEIGMILINGVEAGMTRIVNPGDMIAIYPFFFDLFPDRPLADNKSEGRFIVDVNLGKLAKNLRMLGFDTIYSNQFSDRELVEIANQENRIILTRDLGLLKRTDARRGLYLRSDDPDKQLDEVLNNLVITEKPKPLTRCLECNYILETVEKDKINHMIEEGTRKEFKEFFQCPGCHKVYWKGSHYERMKNKIANLFRYHQ